MTAQEETAKWKEKLHLLKQPVQLNRHERRKLVALARMEKELQLLQKGKKS